MAHPFGRRGCCRSCVHCGSFVSSHPSSNGELGPNYACLHLSSSPPPPHRFFSRFLIMPRRHALCAVMTGSTTSLSSPPTAMICIGRTYAFPLPAADFAWDVSIYFCLRFKLTVLLDLPYG
jgi:hypothetical protein